jgi:hypothetical protein
LLGFSLNADCVRCVECHKNQQGLARARELYETLFHPHDRTIDETLQMADACLTLIEAGIFSTQQTQRARSLLNAVPDDADIRKRPGYARLKQRAAAAEQQGQGGEAAT